MRTEAFKSSLPLHALLPDVSNEAGLDTAENEKEVKPILTKERRIEEGYKAVWFKEDIDPNAKEEVVIIPDRREDDSDEEDGPDNKTPKVNFEDTDLDSGLGVKMGDQPEDSDGDEAMTSDLWAETDDRHVAGTAYNKNMMINQLLTPLSLMTEDHRNRIRTVDTLCWEIKKK